MPETMNAAEMLEQYSKTPTGVFSVPHSDGRQWNFDNEFSNLLEAVQAVIDDGDAHAGYKLMIHQPEGDRTVRDAELAALIDEVRRLQ